MRLDLEAGDCEALAPGWPAQPVNTASALALVAVGVGVLAAARLARPARPGVAAVPGGFRAALGALVALAGVASVAYHGWATAPARYGHDLANVVLLGLVVGGLGATRRRWRSARAWWPAAGAPLVAAPLLAVVPAASDALVAGLALAALVVAATGPRARRPRVRRARAVQLAAVALGVLALVAGRGASPWCDPAAAWQWHSAWHVLVAAALAAWAVELHLAPRRRQPAAGRAARGRRRHPRRRVRRADHDLRVVAARARPGRPQRPRPLRVGGERVPAHRLVLPDNTPGGVVLHRYVDDGAITGTDSVGDAGDGFALDRATTGISISGADAFGQLRWAKRH